ncbi:hypothetical protein [Chryseobacterium geocarposphaerae]|uniref:Uncharacterized protein n=1 Tax=Chryseobacterium geocarposphaerae TaxID=1416776 RepID=A0A2M9CBS0_9FLAO|nr:hypothetical protein [Chryseobacterium geocarposphaerae]PJJ68279.1 hypothetical protein CLV73_2316 [Chryseobacterium geocarposphaerae]
MISVEHKKEVRVYLLSKKISLDLLIELEDHFLSQIDDLMIQNISFDDAFNDVKQIWSDELRMIKNYSGKEASAFAKKIKQQKINQILLQSSLLTIAIVLSVILLIKNNTQENFINLMRYFLFIFMGLPAFHYLFNIKNFLLISKLKPLQINVYQGLNTIIFILSFIIGYGGTSLLKMGERLFNFVDNPTGMGCVAFILVCTYSFLYSFGFFSQIAFVKSMKKINPYLKTL